MAITQDGRVIVSACGSDRDGGSQVVQWDLETNNPICKELQFASTICSLAVSPDGKLFATGGTDGCVRVSEVGSANVANEFLLKSPVYRVCWSATSNRIFATTATSIFSCSIQEAERPNRLFKTKREQRLRLSPDGQRLAAFGGVSVDVINAVTGEVICPTVRHRLKVSAVRWTPDGNLLTASDDYFVREWNTQTGSLVGELFRAPGWIWDLQCSRDASRILIGTENTGQASVAKPGEARIWDRKTGEPISDSLSHSFHVLGARFSPNEKLVVTASVDRTTAIWDVATNRQLKKLEHPGTVYEAKFHKDGKQVISRACEFIFIWPAAGSE